MKHLFNLGLGLVLSANATVGQAAEPRSPLTAAEADRYQCLLPSNAGELLAVFTETPEGQTFNNDFSMLFRGQPDNGPHVDFYTEDGLDTALATAKATLDAIKNSGSDELRKLADYFEQHIAENEKAKAAMQAEKENPNSEICPSV